MKQLTQLIILLLVFEISYSQRQSNIWCFGDSAGIEFSNFNPKPIKSSVKSRGSCASISDTLGNLLFYYAYDAKGTLGQGPPFYNGNVYDSSGVLMQNGDSIISGLWYNEGLIIPMPDSIDKHYLFSIGVTGNFGLYYSIIDMTLNNGLGAVTQKNIQLLPYEANDGLIAVKHGNGRDWWLLFKRSIVLNDEYYLFLIDPQGIHPQPIQHIGAMLMTNALNYTFNKDGSQLAMVNYDGLVELFDFDRCTGILSNYKLIRAMNTQPPSPGMFSGEFSSNGKYLYISTVRMPIAIIQLDLQASNIWNSADTIYTDTTCIFCGGALKRGPDDKIYWSRVYYDGFNFPYPYPDTTYNYRNMNLSVINEPDSAGLACNLTPYSFYLGGYRTYYGLPNNPDYDLGPLVGSPCDTLGLNTPNPPAGDLNTGVLQCTYVSSWSKVFINASGVKGKDVTVSIYGNSGLLVRKFTSLPVNSGYVTLDVECGAGGSPSGAGGAGWSNGIYIVNLQSEKESLSTKFIKQ